MCVCVCVCKVSKPKLKGNLRKKILRKMWELISAALLSILSLAVFPWDRRWQPAGLDRVWKHQEGTDCIVCLKKALRPLISLSKGQPVSVSSGWFQNETSRHKTFSAVLWIHLLPPVLVILPWLVLQEQAVMCARTWSDAVLPVILPSSSFTESDYHLLLLC